MLENLQNTFHGTGIYIFDQKVTRSKFLSNKNDSRIDENTSLLVAAKAVVRD